MCKQRIVTQYTKSNPNRSGGNKLEPSGAKVIDAEWLNPQSLVSHHDSHITLYNEGEVDRTYCI